MPPLRTSPSGSICRSTMPPRSPRRYEHPDLVTLPDGAREHLQVRQLLVRLEPARRVEMESLGDPARPNAQLGRQGGHHLEPRGRNHRPETELRRGTGQPGQEDGLRFVRGEAGQAGSVAVDEADPTVRSAFRVDRDTGLGEGLDVAIDRPDRDLQLLGQLGGRHPAARLQEEQDIDQSTGSHPPTIRPFMTGSVRYERDDPGHARALR